VEETKDEAAIVKYLKEKREEKLKQAAKRLITGQPKRNIKILEKGRQRKELKLKKERTPLDAKKPKKDKKKRDKKKKSITIITPLSVPDDILKSGKNGTSLRRKKSRKPSASLSSSRTSATRTTTRS